MFRLFFISTIFISSVFGTNAKLDASKFKSFTGKVTGSKVRIRTSPDLDSHIVSQLNKNDIVLITQDAKDFWGIKPLTSVKGYVYKNYISDNTVEADRVNIRLEPNLDSPIIAQLQKNDKINYVTVSQNTKWLEIDLPATANFYVAKEYISYAGSEDYYVKTQNRKKDVEKLLNSAYFITQAECKKPYDEMSCQEAIDQFDAIIKEFYDFPKHVQQAKEGLALLQDNYLQKKIAYLEAKANISHMEKNELIQALEKTKDVDNYEELAQSDHVNIQNISKKMKFWEPIENSLYSTWTTFHPDKSQKDFYKEQDVNSIAISGTIKSFSSSIKNKPGDYIVLKSDDSKAFLYSTKINLDDFVGKKVTLKVSPRSNNNFAYPAFFVNSIEVQ